MVNIEQLINEVHLEEPIWNKEIPQHHNKDALHVSWLKVAVSCIENFNELDDTTKNMKVDELKKKWRSIRDTYRKKCVTKSGQAASKSKKYVFANILEFLRPVMENRRTESNYEISSDSDEQTEFNETQDSVIEEHADYSHCESQSQMPPNSTKRKAFKMPAKKQVNFEEELLSILQNRPPEEEDPEKSFLHSLLPQIRSLTEDQKMQVYSGFIDVIQKVKSLPKHPTNLNTEVQSSYQSFPSNAPPYYQTYPQNSASSNIQRFDPYLYSNSINQLGPKQLFYPPEISHSNHHLYQSPHHLSHPGKNISSLTSPSHLNNSSQNRSPINMLSQDTSSFPAPSETLSCIPPSTSTN